MKYEDDLSCITRSYTLSLPPPLPSQSPANLFSLVVPRLQGVVQYSAGVGGGSQLSQLELQAGQLRLHALAAQLQRLAAGRQLGPPPREPQLTSFRRMSPASRESSRIALLVLAAALSSASCSSRLVSCAFTLSLLSFSCWQLAVSSASSFSDLQFRKLGECWKLDRIPYIPVLMISDADSESRNLDPDLGCAESGSWPRFFNPQEIDKFCYENTKFLGLALKNPPKKTQKNPKKPTLKNPLKWVFLVFFKFLIFYENNTNFSLSTRFMNK